MSSWIPLRKMRRFQAVMRVEVSAVRWMTALRKATRSRQMTASEPIATYSWMGSFDPWRSLPHPDSRRSE